MSAPSSAPNPKRSGIPSTAVVVGGLLLLGLLALLLAGVRLSDRPDREALPSPLIGKPVPEFALPLLHEDGVRVSAADLRGQPYLLNVWGSWCPECRIEHPLLTGLAESGRIRLIGYNLKDEPADAQRWLERFGDPYTLVIADIEGRTAIDWGIYGAPETFLVDGDGIIRWKRVGVITEEILETHLLPLLERIEAGG